MTNNIDHFRELVDQAWEKHSHDHFRAPTAHDIEILIKTSLMPLALKTQNDSFKFIHELKQEMHADLKYVESVKKEIDKLESDKAEFSNMYDLLLHECLSQDVMCSYLHSLSDLDAHTKLQCLYIHKVKECEYKNIAISELKKLIEKCKGKSVETKFDKPSVVRQPNAQRIPKPSVLCKPTPFSDSLDRTSFSKTKSVPKTNVSKGLSKPVTTQILPQTARQAVRNTNVIKPGMHRINTRLTQTRAPQLPQTSRNTNPRVSTSTGIVHLILFIVDSGCTKYMTGNLKLMCNFVEKYLGTVRFGNDQFALILGYGDLVQGNIMINMVYYVEGLNHNLFSVGYFCDADLDVAFRKSTCFVRDLQGNDLLTGNRGSDLYTISLQETTSIPICFMAKASPTQAWLWHQRLSYLNFNYINLLSKKDIVIGLPMLKYVKDQLCSSCVVTKAKKDFIQDKGCSKFKRTVKLLHMNLCRLMRVESINEKKYILVIVDDYSRYTWTLFLRSKDKTPEVLKDFLKMIQCNLQAQVITVRTDKASTPRTPEQNGVIERRNRTLVEAARTMLSASKLPLFFWAEAIAIACYTQNRSIIILTHENTAYDVINDRKPSIRHLHIFGCTCYLTRYGENLDKMKEKRDPCILMGYSNQSKGYKVYNKRTRLIVESIHLRFDDIKEMSETSVASNTSGLVLQRQKASDYDNSGPVPRLQNVSPLVDTTASSQQELDLLFSPL
ncbi:retrovirus-related pol polyprotein from transposon TNT 1-94 [Tanacetum coccineum]